MDALTLALYGDCDSGVGHTYLEDLEDVRFSLARCGERLRGPLNVEFEPLSCHPWQQDQHDTHQ